MTKLHLVDEFAPQLQEHALKVTRSHGLPRTVHHNQSPPKETPYVNSHLADDNVTLLYDVIVLATRASTSAGVLLSRSLLTSERCSKR